MVLKSWKKIGDSYYFFLNHKVIGSLQIATNSTAQVCKAKINEDEYTFVKTGFWLNAFEIKDQDQNVIAFAKSEKWYANTLLLKLNNEDFKIKVRNNPLVEWFIIDANETEVASCGLKSEHKKIEVQLSATNTNLMLEFILWYLFLPVVVENFTSEISFLETSLGN